MHPFVSLPVAPGFSGIGFRHWSGTDLALASAEAGARRAIELEPSSGGYLGWLGDLYLRQKRYTEALGQYELAGSISTDPTWIWRSHRRMAQVFAAMGEPQRAVQEQRTCLQLGLEQGASPAQLADNYVFLGDLLLSMEDAAGAGQAYREALPLVPDHPAAITKLQRLESGGQGYNFRQSF